MLTALLFHHTARAKRQRLHNLWVTFDGLCLEDVAFLDIGAEHEFVHPLRRELILHHALVSASLWIEQQFFNDQLEDLHVLREFPHQIRHLFIAL